MRHATVWALNAALLLLLLCAQWREASGGWIPTVYTATLEGSQAAPTVGSTTSRGVAVCVLARHLQPITVDCEVSHSVPASDVVEVALHRGGRGTTDFLDPLYVFAAQSIAQHQFRERFQLTPLTRLTPNVNPRPGEAAFTEEIYSVEAQVDDFLNGLWNINVLTGAFPRGEIRGQLEHAHRVFARLEGDGRVNQDGSIPTATGLAIGKYSPLEPRRTLSWELLHNVEDVIGVEVTRAPATDVGHSVVYQWDNIFSPVLERYELSAAMERDMFVDGHHLNVLSASDPDIGEIRSEIHTIDHVPKDEVSFAAKLTGRDVVPIVSTAARGCALFTLDCTSRLLEYFIVHTVQQPIGANLYRGAPGETGLQLFALSSSASPIYGSIVLDVNHFFPVLTEGAYVDVASALYPRGEIRGAITAQRDWVAYLSGTGMPSPVTTSAVGCATFQVIAERGEVVLNYDITHSVKRPQVLTLRRGEEWVESERIIRQWGEYNGRLEPTVTGDDEDLNEGELRDFRFEKTYLQVDSDDYPSGEIRGQVFRLRPCNKASTPYSDLVDPFLPPLIPPPPPPSPNDPFVVAEVTIDNTTVEIVIGRINGNWGAGSVLSPHVWMLVAAVALGMALFVAVL
eukprot:TRINITY_DN2588_c0_g1_i4.p1 TRINITY_DN2588_c0_g1~~TRINITY_DN2588_c0_g1_i4.p1  ORF type:complete len:634 (-),score=275.03 TRINITY_DN2588_c0_g1_i4:1018-2892(-)